MIKPKEIIKKMLSTFIYTNTRIPFLFKKTLNPENIKTILFICIKPTGIGDFIMDTPSIRLVRKAFPKARISVLTDKDLLRDNPNVDEIIIVKNYKEAWLHNKKYDLVILPNKNLIASSLAVFKLRWKYIIGYIYSWEVAGNIKGINGRFDIHKTHLRRQPYEVVKNLGVGKFVEAIDPVIFNDEELRKVKEMLYNPHNRKVVLVHPAGLCRSRTWPKEKYSELIRLLVKDNYLVVVHGAKYDEEYNKHFNQPGVLNLTGKLNLYEFSALCSQAKLVITNDGGPMHVALSTKTPTLTLWGVTDPNRRLPSNGLNKYICAEGIPRDLYYFEYESDDNRIDKISVEEVYQEAINMLQR